MIVSNHILNNQGRYFEHFTGAHVVTCTIIKIMYGELFMIGDEQPFTEMRITDCSVRLSQAFKVRTCRIIMKKRWCYSIAIRSVNDHVVGS